MKVKMKKQTVWNGQVLRPGDTPDIETAAAKRWLRHRIAGPCEQAGEEEFPVIKEIKIIYNRAELEQMKYGELRKIAIDQGKAVKFAVKKAGLIDLILGEKTEPEKKQTEKKTS